MTGLQTLLTAAAGVLFAVKGQLSSGEYIALISYAIMLSEPEKSIGRLISEMSRAWISLDRLRSIMNSQTETNKEHTLTPPMDRDIVFGHVSFGYGQGNGEVLEDVSFTVPGGSTLRILGGTGSGKTTLVNLICRFYEPTQGTVLIDGKDVRERSQLWLHSNLGYVMQTPQLFAGTIRENLKIGNPEATDEQIMKALRDVCAETVVRKQEKGLDTYIGEGGGFLSTGEKQLLSFARVILADPKILVLDEATSSVDSLTEKEILQAAEALIRGRTSFVIAHRMSTIRNADRVLVLSDGKIVNESMGTYQ